VDGRVWNILRHITSFTRGSGLIENWVTMASTSIQMLDRWQVIHCQISARQSVGRALWDCLRCVPGPWLDIWKKTRAVIIGKSGLGAQFDESDEVPSSQGYDWLLLVIDQNPAGTGALCTIWGTETRALYPWISCKGVMNLMIDRLLTQGCSDSYKANQEITSPVDASWKDWGLLISKADIWTRY
jgi:hypothetical protein